MNELIKLQWGNSLPAWSGPGSLFLLASAVTCFPGSGWGAASLIMPSAIPPAASVGSGIPLGVAAVLTGGTFGDVTSPVAGMTNMSSNLAHADHGKYIADAGPLNFRAAAFAALLFVLTGVSNEGFSAMHRSGIVSAGDFSSLTPA